MFVSFVLFTLRVMDFVARRLWFCLTTFLILLIALTFALIMHGYVKTGVICLIVGVYIPGFCYFLRCAAVNGWFRRKNLGR